MSSSVRTAAALGGFASAGRCHCMLVPQAPPRLPVGCGAVPRSRSAGSANRDELRLFSPHSRASRLQPLPLPCGTDIRSVSRRHGRKPHQPLQPSRTATSATLASQHPTLRPSNIKLQGKLVHELIAGGTIKTAGVANVMRQVDRGEFIPKPTSSLFSLSSLAVYNDSPYPLGHGQTISAPTMHAMCLELLSEGGRLAGDERRVLDVGAGSGYLTVCLALLVGPSGYVLGVERDPMLAGRARDNIRKSHAALLDAAELRAATATATATAGGGAHSEASSSLPSASAAHPPPHAAGAQSADAHRSSQVAPSGQDSPSSSSSSSPLAVGAQAQAQPQPQPQPAAAAAAAAAAAGTAGTAAAAAAAGAGAAPVPAHGVRIVAANVLEGATLMAEGPFHAIHVGAASERVPGVLVEKLAPGGRMVIPVGVAGEVQELKVVDKDADGRVTVRDVCAVRYVPLIPPTAGDAR